MLGWMEDVQAVTLKVPQRDGLFLCDRSSRQRRRTSIQSAVGGRTTRLKH